MKYDSATPYVASYVLLEKDGRYAFVLRSHTPWMNGYYGLPAGKVDQAEPYTQAAVREANEEVGVTIKPSDLQFVHVMHRREESEWVDVFFRADTWSGTVHNAEPDKHAAVEWFTLDSLPDNTIPSLREALQCIQRGECFSEYGWS